MFRKKLRIAFLHPDLGLGGAERLVVDAASELVKSGHHVDMYTTYYDPTRCFEETRGSGGFSVTVVGGWFPRQILGRMIALCAYIRCILAALSMVWISWTYRSPTIMAGWQPCYDVIIVDQVSAAVPFLRLTSSKLLFYCHFPDLLLVQGRSSSALKRLYRAPLDLLEELSTGMADLILVNSNYTRGVFKDTFRRLYSSGVNPEVAYPAVPIPSDTQLRDAESKWSSELDPTLVSFMRGGSSNSSTSLSSPQLLLSINRFERKKGIGLAVQALATLYKMRKAEEAGGRRQLPPKPRLVIAGGYDKRLAENREHLEELKQQVQQLGLQDQVMFLPSFTDRQRTLLLAACTAVLYTPQNEHFGIVPLEAMAAGRPVVACSSGGPLESVVDGSTGWLCEPRAETWAEAISKLMEPGAAKAMGVAARRHVMSKFSREFLGKQLDGFVRRLANSSAM
jgi:alpha-1,3/alpha-1,6-mannosyltransferase